MKTISVLSLILSREVKKYLKNGNLAEAGSAVDVEAVLLGDDAGEEAGFAVLEGDDLLGGALTDDGLVNAADGDGADLGEHLNLHLEGDLAVVVDRGCHVDVDADVDVGELGLHADAGDTGGDAGVIGAGGDGDLLIRSSWLRAGRRWRGCWGSEGCGCRRR